MIKEKIRMRLMVLSGLLLILTLFLSCGGNKDGDLKNSQGKSDSGAAEVKNGKPGFGPGGFANGDPAAIPVEVTPVVLGDISDYLLYNSTVETEEFAEVYSRIAGVVEKLSVEEGDWVKKNQPMLQIEQQEYILEEQKARLQYDKQKSEFNRFKALKDKNLVSEEEFETARLAQRQAELAWKQAQLNLDYTIIRAPINGVVGERTVRLGDRIQPSTKLFLISNLADKVVKLYVPQDKLTNSYVNQKVIITTEVLPDIEFQGWVKRISPIVDPVSGTFKITVGVKDPKNKLRPGVFVNARLIVDKHENTTLIPKTALVYENERSYFYTINSDTARKFELKKGFEDAEKVEVENDIPDSALIVVIGQGGLKDGSKIKVTNHRYYSWQNISETEMAGKDSGQKKNTSQLDKAGKLSDKN
jgi:membrane fusion protein (multidrug efflux system)